MLDFPGDSVVKNLPVNAGDMGLIPGLERSPREGNDNPLQYSCLGNPMDREAWQVTVHGVMKELDMTYRLNTEKAMAPHSSTLAWKIPWTEEPGRLQFMGLQSLGNWLSD